LQLKSNKDDESNSLSFNSYTQQICIDDAVVIDPDCIDNSVTNDSFIKRELRYGIGARAVDDGYENDEEQEENKFQPQSQLSEGIPTAAALTGTEASGGAVRELSKRGPSQIVSYSSRFVNKIRYLMARLSNLLHFTIP
jgi:hypothetical protein